MNLNLTGQIIVGTLGLVVAGGLLALAVLAIEREVGARKRRRGRP